MLPDSFVKKKAEAKSKERHGKNSLEAAVMQNSGYHEFPTIEEWVAKKNEFHMVGLGHTRPFPLVSKVSSNADLVDYHQNHVAPRLSGILANHNGIRLG